VGVYLTLRSHGFVVGHVVPEAQVGGPIALVQDGDIITIDAEANTLNVDVSEEELATRKANWVAPPLRPKKGALLKYARNVTDASRGCGEFFSACVVCIGDANGIVTDW
jgi:dihydroxy-acid dehydratase